jgi:hypothetical protein
MFINQLDSKKIVELGKIVLKKYVDKVENSNVYSIYNITRTFLLGAIIIDKQNITTKSGQQDIVKSFIENYNHADSSLLTEISKILSELL